MRNPSSRSVRPFAVAVLLGAALVMGDVTAPAAHAIDRFAPASRPSAAGSSPHAAVSRRIVRPQRRFRPQRRVFVRVSRSASRIRPRVARAVRLPLPLGHDAWARLRRCESGGRYDINTGNGFYGAYQFVPSTWRELGYPGMPHQAPPHIQDEAAQKLQARSGWGQWPACSRKLGLR